MNQKEKISVNQTSEYCSAYVYKKDMSVRATVEASLVGGEWWVNRVIVQPEKQRGRGLGGRLLEELKKVVAKEGGEVLMVTPGGYNSEYADQVNFYKCHGFEEVNAGEDGLLQVELKKRNIDD